MDDSNASGLCEEPDADFFDTFFDDGVLDTIGEVFAEHKPDEAEDSSRDSVEEIARVSSPNVALSDKKNEHAPLSNNQTEDGHQKENGIITLKPACIHDPENPPECTSDHKTNKNYTVKSDNASATTSFGSVQRNALKQLKEFHKDNSSEIIKTQRLENRSSLQADEKQKVDPKPSISMDDLLAKVKKILKETPGTGSKETPKEVPKDDLLAKVKEILKETPGTGCKETPTEVPKDVRLKLDNPDNGLAKNVDEVTVAINTPGTITISKTDAVREEISKKPDIKPLSRERLPCSNSLPDSSQEDLSSSTVTEQSIIEEGEIKEDSVPSSCILSTSNGSVSATKTAIPNFKTGKSKDEAEKENDLTLEKTFQKSGNVQSEKKKIPINIKSQLLASTSIINSGSSSKSSSSSTRETKKGESSLLSKEVYSSLSSLSDESGPSWQSQRENNKKRKQNSCSSESESSDVGRRKHNSEDRSKRSKKKKKRDDSPQSRRRRESKKSKHRRSRSRSPYNSYRRKMSPKRPRYKRQRSGSRSPVPYRGRKSPSPSTNRRRRSRSRARTRSRSRSRSRSPFINEISRLKKQWEREDEAKKSSSRHLHSSLPLVGSWPSESTNTTSTTIVSNMLSLSGDSVHVHRTSYTSIEAFPHGYQGYMNSLPSFGPNHYGGAQIMGPEYTSCNNGGSYSGFNTNPPVPAQVVAPGILQLPPVPGLNTSICPPMIQAVSDLSPHILSVDLTTPPPIIQTVPGQNPHLPAQPQTSVLRKQLDILKSTVASLPEPCTSPNQLGTNTALIITDVPEQAKKNMTEIPNSKEPSKNSKNSKEPSKNSKNSKELPKNSKTSEEPSKNSKELTDNSKNSKEHTDNSKNSRELTEKSRNSKELSKNSKEHPKHSNNSKELSKNSKELTKHSNNSKELPKNSKNSTPASNVSNNCITTRSNLTQIVLSPEISFKSSSECLPQSIVCGKESSHERVRRNLNDETGLQQLQDEVISVETSTITKVECPGPNNTLGEDSDSDIIIEEPPPKPPVELICLSADEGNEDDIGNEGNVDKTRNKSDGGIEGIEVSKGDASNEGDEGDNNLYDLDKELDKIDKDMSLRSTAKNTNNSLEIPNDSESSRKKRKRKRSKRSHSKRKESAEQSIDHETSRKEKLSDVETKSSDSQNPVLKECLEMIDSLRYGRFVIIDTNSEPELFSHQETEGSNSRLKTRQITEFSYTKKPNLEVTSNTRSVATNTGAQLCIDVCIGTDNTVIQKDSMVQTDFKCLGCFEKRDVIEEMKSKILELEKERDDLQAKLLTHSIPGLCTSSGLEAALSSMESTSRANSSNTQSSKSSRGSSDTSIHLQSTNHFNDKDDRLLNEPQRRNKSAHIQLIRKVE
ncbi:serine/arginine repetitive matrix protein 2-like isoform X3 [Frankliniella occidentalis]|uniref:Serine/arginine repetitive matrix protein 2-like isoform X3 n=1 Tax=Frankliniella occidentalis TaxID=133901 RepID=A0A6J1TL26_FRAOC|nr:serine/arginine repetitive matrix protein 2-like isoform X3 [Frankliniella occidentalis]XP_026294200.2 serine/arginine repetitive matrix protein 2-like isoform X3 [Frankliniella occidentalis]